MTSLHQSICLFRYILSCTIFRKKKFVKSYQDKSFGLYTKHSYATDPWPGHT